MLLEADPVGSEGRAEVGSLGWFRKSLNTGKTRRGYECGVVEAGGREHEATKSIGLLGNSGLDQDGGGGLSRSADRSARLCRQARSQHGAEVAKRRGSGETRTTEDEGRDLSQEAAAEEMRLVGCRIESLVEMGKTSGWRFVCRRRAWTWTGETGSRGRQLDSGHGHGWRVGDGQRGARKENNARSDSRGAMCAIRDPTIVEVAREMGFGASGPAECCRAGKRRGLDRKSDDNPVAKPILFSVPLSAWQAGLGAGRANLQGRGGFETRPHAGVGLSVAVDAALRRVGGDGTKRATGSRDVGGQKYLHRDPRKADLQMAMARASLWQWAMGNRMEMAMANFTGRRDRERTRASSPTCWTR